MNFKSKSSFRQSIYPKFKNDILFIGIILFVTLCAGLIYFFTCSDGDIVTVTVNGEIFGKYSLSQNTHVEILTGEQNEELNLLIIQDGKACIQTATCPDGICSSHKPISRSGETIICLPHRVIVTVSAFKTDSEIDIVA